MYGKTQQVKLAVKTSGYIDKILREKSHVRCVLFMLATDRQYWCLKVAAVGSCC
jgi:hypothetical protein